MKNITILGSTGSIGVQTLEVCKNLGYKILALTANENVDLLAEQALQYHPRYVVIANSAKYTALKSLLEFENVTVLSGEEGIQQVVQLQENDFVLNAIVGIAGLKPTLFTLQAGTTLALANKESLVAGGKLVLETAQSAGVEILPVDSEHSAIFQCLQKSDRAELKKILLTASGGPFFGKQKEELKEVTVEQALKHPNWSMGSKITIDSATLMNKGLECIEAAWLFSCKTEQIEILVHRESIIHSMVEFVDGAILAQMGIPDMKIPIQYALTYPQRMPLNISSLSFSDLKSLSFAAPDYDTFLCLSACIRAFQKGTLSPCIANGANEQAVSLFLQHKISFLQIGELVSETVEMLSSGSGCTLSAILEKDQEAREYVLSHYHKFRKEVL